LKDTPEIILFFDGVCNLCNGFIDFLVKRDVAARIKYAPLQGEVAKATVPEHAQSLSSVVLYKSGRVYTESTAAILALAELGGLWGALKFLLIFPKFLRDSVYRFVARNRYKWFGKKETCRLPTTEERARFLP